MDGPITIAGIDIDPARFPQICWFGQQNPEMVEEKLLGLLQTLGLEDAVETLEAELSS